MSALADLLDRLRRLRPPPGRPASIVAVPSPAQGVGHEVAFLFDTLDAVDAQARRLIESARAEAESLEAEARSERSRILAEARREADRGWERELSRQRSATEPEAEAILSDARHTAALLTARGRASTPALVDEVVRRIREPAC